jgi:hypothetical protein
MFPLRVERDGLRPLVHRWSRTIVTKATYDCAEATAAQDAARLSGTHRDYNTSVPAQSIVDDQPKCLRFMHEAVRQRVVYHYLPGADDARSCSCSSQDSSPAGSVLHVSNMTRERLVTVDDHGSPRPLCTYSGSHQPVVGGPAQARDELSETDCLATDNEARTDTGDFDVGAMCEEEEDVEDAPLGDEDGESYHEVRGEGGRTQIITSGPSSALQPEHTDRVHTRTVLSFMHFLRDPTKLLKPSLNRISSSTLPLNTTPSLCQSTALVTTNPSCSRWTASQTAAQSATPLTPQRSTGNWFINTPSTSQTTSQSATPVTATQPPSLCATPFTATPATSVCPTTTRSTSDQSILNACTSQSMSQWTIPLATGLSAFRTESITQFRTRSTAAWSTSRFTAVPLASPSASQSIHSLTGTSSPSKSIVSFPTPPLNSDSTAIGNGVRSSRFHSHTQPTRKTPTRSTLSGMVPRSRPRDVDGSMLQTSAISSTARKPPAVVPVDISVKTSWKQVRSVF